MRGSVIRCGEKKEYNSFQDDISCLQNYWALEEQLGIRSPVNERFMVDVPQLEPKVMSENELKKIGMIR